MLPTFVARSRSAEPTHAPKTLPAGELGQPILRPSQRGAGRPAARAAECLSGLCAATPIPSPVQVLWIPAQAPERCRSFALNTAGTLTASPGIKPCAVRSPSADLLDCAARRRHLGQRTNDSSIPDRAGAHVPGSPVGARGGGKKPPFARRQDPLTITVTALRTGPEDDDTDRPLTKVGAEPWDDRFGNR